VELFFLAWVLGTNCNIYVPKRSILVSTKRIQNISDFLTLPAQLWENIRQEQHNKLHELTSQKLNAK
jgi:hypothetical protein